MSTESAACAVALLRGWKILAGCDGALLSKVRFFHSFSNKGALLVTSDDTVFGIGQNGKHNLLGVEGDHFEQEFFQEPVRIARLCSLGVTEISVGMWLGAAVTREGLLYRWGLISDEGDVVLPTQVILDQGARFTRVSCGAAFLAALTETYCVYVWGSMNMCSDPVEARLVSGCQLVSSFSCGWWHIAMVTDKGDVYTCGYGEDGQLGYVWHEHDDIYNAKKADVRPTMKKVSCGSISTLCLSTYGDIWACGANDVWQGFLGVDSDDDCVCSPMKIGVSDNIKDIVSTWGAPNTYAAVDDVGLVFCWGKNRNPVQLDNVSSVFEVGQNGRASLDLESICFPINHCRSSSIQPLALQEESQSITEAEHDSTKEENGDFVEEYYKESSLVNRNGRKDSKSGSENEQEGIERTNDCA